MADSKANLLYVEDDESLSFVTRDNLELNGYMVTYCEDGGKAMQLIQLDWVKKVTVELFAFLLAHIHRI
jgi:DNA-binding response OmpR family regulator